MMQIVIWSWCHDKIAWGFFLSLMQVQEQFNHRSLSGSLFSFFLKKIGRSLHADKARHRSHRTQDDESLVNIQRTFSLTVTQSEEKNAVIDRQLGDCMSQCYVPSNSFGVLMGTRDKKIPGQWCNRCAYQFAGSCTGRKTGSPIDGFNNRIIKNKSIARPFGSNGVKI